MRFSIALLVVCLTAGTVLGQGGPGGPGGDGCEGLQINVAECSVIETIPCDELQGATDEETLCADTPCEYSFILDDFVCPSGTKKIRANPAKSADGTTAATEQGFTAFQSTDCVKCLQERACSGCLPVSNLCADGGGVWADLDFPRWLKLEAVGSPCTAL